MLVLTRREGETFRLGDDIEIEILDIKPGVVRVGIRAPKSVRILRSELIEAVVAANHIASNGADLAAATAVTVESAPVTRRTSQPSPPAPTDADAHANAHANAHADPVAAPQC